jgi:hypothetical protein
LAGESITAIAISKNPANRLYYGTNKKKMYKIDNANSGTPSATQITSSLFPTNGYVSCIAVNPNDADKVLAVFSNYNVYSLFYTSDGGTTWQKAGGNLEQFTTGTGNGPSCRWASILPVSDGNIFLLGTSTGLYATDTLKNTATTWVRQGVGNVGSSIVDMIDTRVSDGLVVVGTHGNGMYSTHLTSIQNITGIKSNFYSAADFKIFPNPASSVLTIQLPDEFPAVNLQATILNDLGQTVRMVFLTPNSNTSYSTNVNGLPKGLYYLQFTAKDRIFAKDFIKK